MLEGSRLSRGKSSVGQFSYDAVFQGRVFLGTIIYVRSFSGGNFLETVCLESLIISQVRRSEKQEKIFIEIVCFKFFNN